MKIICSNVKNNNNFLGYCVTCGNDKATYVCEGCRTARYCSRSCQRLHWKNEHSCMCSILRSEAEEGTTTTLQKVVADLFQIELNWFQNLSIEKRRTVDRARQRNTNVREVYFRSPNVALVLARLIPGDHLIHYDLRTDYGALYYDEVLQPWYHRHRTFLREQGFRVHWTVCSVPPFLPAQFTGGNGLMYSPIVKDKLNPDIDKVDRIFHRCRRRRRRRGNNSESPDTILPYTMQEFIDMYLKCFPQPSLTDDSPNQCSGDVIFRVDSAPVQNDEDLPISKYLIGQPCLVIRNLSPAYAFYVGQMFFEYYVKMKRIGIELRLDILSIHAWPDRAIATTWIAAADGNLPAVLHWVDRDVILETKFLNDRRLDRILKEIVIVANELVEIVEIANEVD